MTKVKTSFNTGYLLVMAGAVLWGTTGAAQSFAPPGTDPLTLGFCRILFGGIFLLIFDSRKNGLNLFKGPWPLKPTLSAAMGMGFFQLFFFAALLRTGVAVGTMIAIGSGPIFAGILGKFFFGENLSKRWYLATAVAIGGCALLFLPQGSFRVDPLGILLALGAGVSWTAAGSSIKKMPSERSAVEKAAIVFFLGCLIIFPFVFFRDFSWVISGSGAMVVLYLGFMGTALPYSFFAEGISTTPVSIAYTLTLAEPLTAASLGIFLLGEELTPLALTGMTMIFAGLGILSVKWRALARPTPEAKSTENTKRSIPDGDQD